MFFTAALNLLEIDHVRESKEKPERGGYSRCRGVTDGGSCTGRECITESWIYNQGMGTLILLASSIGLFVMLVMLFQYIER
jgi:hypothetical protein